MDGAGLYAANAAGMWQAAGTPLPADPRYAGFTAYGAVRVVLRRPLGAPSIAGIVAALPAGRMTLEDPYGLAAPQQLPDVMVRRMPVMNRPPGPPPAGQRDGISVEPVTGPDTLATAERVIVDGFPYPHLQPWTAGRALTPRLLHAPGWRAWLARRDGAPAAAGYTFDDGTALGVYSLATLPEHRRAGLARALLTAMLAAHPRRTATLVATEAGRPLYAALGFVTVSTATWYFRAG
ncbi:hypothetical protein CS0771_52030 [Catellatospora sp. IY07-71]|uniref:GNAT family N-acetyltransferase n=1 Tax=Catellatospora sp. IY07-71 TaxID=2728827 RepID=UPI001BB51438|nr:GNAT family N-acetyltransferase [Catellatospora sp. IY07-71]BCJ75659.1 hypothetical protein CS0771_52030 [Catellatospora sp. IY07-71]